MNHAHTSPSLECPAGHSLSGSLESVLIGARTRKSPGVGPCTCPGNAAGRLGTDLHATPMESPGVRHDDQVSVGQTVLTTARTDILPTCVCMDY